jgi:hypothetical protein
MANDLVRIRYTLVADGSSDSCLRHIIDWVIRRAVAPGDLQLEPQIPDFRCVLDPPRTLSDRMGKAVQLYPCDILFVHRDAEAQPRDSRLREIREAARLAGISETKVPVVPVRMTEAWLLISELAIRTAADNPNGKTKVELPASGSLESLPDPKAKLHDLLTEASEKHGRRRAQFQRDLPRRVHRLASYIEDYTPLHALPAFQAFEVDARRAVHELLESKRKSE